MFIFAKLRLLILKTAKAVVVVGVFEILKIIYGIVRYVNKFIVLGMLTHTTLLSIPLNDLA